MKQFIFIDKRKTKNKLCFIDKNSDIVKPNIGTNVITHGSKLMIVKSIKLTIRQCLKHELI